MSLTVKMKYKNSISSAAMATEAVFNEDALPSHTIFCFQQRQMPLLHNIKIGLSKNERAEDEEYIHTKEEKEEEEEAIAAAVARLEVRDFMLYGESECITSEATAATLDSITAFTNDADPRPSREAVLNIVKMVAGSLLTKDPEDFARNFLKNFKFDGKDVALIKRAINTLNSACLKNEEELLSQNEYDEDQFSCFSSIHQQESDGPQSNDMSSGSTKEKSFSEMMIYKQMKYQKYSDMQENWIAEDQKKYASNFPIDAQENPKRFYMLTTPMTASEDEIEVKPQEEEEEQAAAAALSPPSLFTTPRPINTNMRSNANGRRNQRRKRRRTAPHREEAATTDNSSFTTIIVADKKE